MTKTNIEFLSDLTRTYTTFIVGAAAMTYYVSGILIKSVDYIILVEFVYVFVWLLIIIWAKEKILREDMKRIKPWIKENYLLIIAFIFFFVLIFLLTREGAAFYDKIISEIKNLFS